MRKNFEGAKREHVINHDENDISENWTANSKLWNTAYTEHGDPLRECLLPIENVLSWLGNANYILDAGCGAGYMTRLLAKLGKRVVGVDSSEGQITLAKEFTEDLDTDIKERIVYQKVSLTHMEEISPSVPFEGAICTTVIENIEDCTKAISEISSKLIPNGKLVLTVIHPCFSMKDLQIIRADDNPKQIKYWTVDNYFERGASAVHYEGMPAPTITFHRTLEDYSLALFRTGFLIERLLEPVPTSEQIAKYPQFLAGRGNRIPRFLVFVAVKIIPPER